MPSSISATASQLAPASSNACAIRVAPCPYALALTTVMMPGAETGSRDARRLSAASRLEVVGDRRVVGSRRIEINMGGRATNHAAMLAGR